MIFQCRFIYYNKDSTLIGNVDHPGGSACVGAGDMWEISVHASSQLYCEPKTTLQKKCFVSFLFLHRKNLVGNKRKGKGSGRDRWEQ